MSIKETRSQAKTHSALQPLATKFVPPSLPQALVSRPRLLNELDAITNHRLELVSASAGSGKTTLLSTWARSLPTGGPQVSWLSLEEIDDDPARFWTLVLLALRASLPLLGETVLQMLRTPQPVPVSIPLTILINELVEREREVVLVLDDFHVIKNEGIYEGMTFLLDHLPANLHLVLSARADPDLPLARWRTRGQMLEIREAHLSFTSAETTQFLTRTLGEPGQPEEIQLLQGRTEGWIAGIQLAAMALRRHDDRTAFLQTFTGSHRYLMDYVQQEILKHLPTSLQQFLLQICVLARMNTDLCQAITDEPASQTFLEEIERHNLFLVPLDNERKWYRFHDLFREVLLAHVQATQPGLLPQLRERAARWYEGQGEIREAVIYALEACNFTYAAMLMEQSIAEIWLRGECQTLFRWIMSLPATEIRQHSRMVLTAALYLLNSTNRNIQEARVKGQAQAEQMMARVEASLRATAELDLSDHEIALLQRRLEVLHLWIESQRIVLERYDREQYQRIELRLQQLDQDDDILWQMIPLNVTFILAYTFDHQPGWLLPRLKSAQQRAKQSGDHYATIRASQWLVMASLEAGQLHTTYQECLVALDLLQQVQGHAILAGYLSGCLVSVLYEWNRLEEAHALAWKNIQKATAWQQIDLYRTGCFSAAEAALALGDLASAEHALQKLEDLVLQGQAGHTVNGIAALRVQSWLATGDLTKASEWATHVTFSRENWSPHRKTEFFMLVRLYCAQAEYTRALELLEHFNTYLDGADASHTTITFLALFFLALHHVGRTDQARRVATRLLALTRPEGFLRVYLDEGEPMRHALQALYDTAAPEALSLHTSVSILLAAFAQEKQRHMKTTETQLVNPPEAAVRSAHGDFPLTSQPLVEPLSFQEQRVLRLLIVGQTYAEIASELIVSVNTVKTQVQSIYRKLGVNRRTQAGEMARRFHLL